MATWAAAGLIGLLLLHRQTGQMNDEINAVGRPARELVGEIQVAFSRRIYTLQEYLLTSDALYLAEYRREDAKLSTLNEGLVPLLTRLGIGTPADVVGSLFADWNSSVETMLVRGPGVDLSESAVVRDGLHSRTLAAISALRDEVNASIRLRLDRIRKLETLQVLIAISLAALALAAALERARLAGLERVARGEAERRARQEAALREAAAAVASARTVEETVRRIAESAVSSTGADAALVERIDAEQAEVEIVAKSGSCGPPVRERFNYAGSVSSRLAEAGGAVHWNSPEDDETVRLKRYVGPSCVGAKVLAVPLRDPERPLGSLILVRGSAGRDFDNDEAERLSIFGELAALEFRRITSLTESERQRRELERVTESRARLLRGFSHDVKNALGAADGYAQLLEDGVVGAPSEEQQVGIGRLRGSIGGALKLTEDLLHLARVEAGRSRSSGRTSRCMPSWCTASRPTALKRSTKALK